MVALVVGFALPCWAADALGGASAPKPQLNLKNENQYKRFHQYALRLMVSEQYGKAEDFLRGYLEKVPDDAESLFMMGVIQAYREDLARSAQWMRRAIDAGLPVDRILAGPLDVITLAEREIFFEKIIEEFAAQPIHGPLLGNVTDQSAAIWVRVAHPARVEVEISESEDFRRIVASSVAAARASMDRTAVVEVAGLKPARRYF